MIRSGKQVFFNSGDIELVLKPGVYVPKFSLDKSLYLEQIEDFEYTEMVGGNCEYEQLVVDHYNKTDGSFGGLFTGISGSGKTQTIKNICIKLNLPVVLVNCPLDMNHLLSIQEASKSNIIFFFDEFEKIYKEDSSETLLSFFDGIKFTSRVLSFASLNEHRRLSTFLFNRPGRFLFNFRYNPLTAAIAIGQFDVPEEYRERLTEFLDKVNDLSWDIVFRIKELIQIHGYNHLEVISKSINLSVSDYYYKVKFEIKDEKTGEITVKVVDVESEKRSMYTPNMKVRNDEDKDDTESGYIGWPHMQRIFSGEKMNIEEICFDTSFANTITVWSEKVKKYTTNYSSLAF